MARVPDLVAHLGQATGLPWVWHAHRDAAVLLFGEAIDNGPSGWVPRYTAIVFCGPELTEWHVDVLAQLERGGQRALRVPGHMSFTQLLEFIALIVERCGGVSELYSPLNT